MIWRHTSSISKKDVVFPTLHYCELSCSKMYHWGSQACYQCSQACSQRTQACCEHSQACCQHSLACSQCTQVLPGAHKVLSSALKCSQTDHTHSLSASVPVIRDPSYSEGQPEHPPKVWYSPEIDASKLTPHILQDTTGGSHWLKDILRMWFIPAQIMCCQYQTTMASWHIQSQMRDELVTDIQDFEALPTQLTCTNQPLFRPHFLHLGK